VGKPRICRYYKKGFFNFVSILVETLLAMTNTLAYKFYHRCKKFIVLASAILYVYEEKPSICINDYKKDFYYFKTLLILTNALA
jgi:hypothetical protein